MRLTVKISQMKQIHTIVLLITIAIGLAPFPTQAGLLQDYIPKHTAVGKMVDGDWQGLGKMAESSVKQIGEGIKQIVNDPQLLMEMTMLAAQCAPKIVAAVGGEYSLIIKDFLGNEHCTQFNRKCGEHAGELLCPNVDGIRDEIVQVCNDPTVQQAISGSQAAQYCAGTVTNAQTGRFSRNDQVFGANPTAQEMQMAQAASGGNQAEFVKALLQDFKDQRKNLLDHQKHLIDSILQSNENQMKELLKMQNEQFKQFGEMNENQRRDFLKALDQNSQHWENVVKEINQAALEGKKLDHDTIMAMISGFKEEREAIYQQHKAEIDRIVKQYNDSLEKTKQEKEAAVRELEEYVTALNRQIIAAMIMHGNCRSYLIKYAWCHDFPQLADNRECVDVKNLCE